MSTKTEPREVRGISLFKGGDTCPCNGCGAALVQEDTGQGFDHIICPECGYCPEEEFDGRIADCPNCGSFAYVINQGNIVCSGCELELTAEDEETALAAWNKVAAPRLPVDAEVRIKMAMLALRSEKHPTEGYNYFPLGTVYESRDEAARIIARTVIEVLTRGEPQ